MKKLLLLMAVLVGVGLFATPKAEAGVFVSVGVPIGFGYPGYYGYGYPYGYGYGYPYGFYGGGFYGGGYGYGRGYYGRGYYGGGRYGYAGRGYGGGRYGYAGRGYAGRGVNRGYANRVSGGRR